MKRLSVLFAFVLVTSMTSIAVSADSSAGMQDHKFKAELTGANIAPVATRATGEVKFELVGAGAGGSVPRDIDEVEPGEVTDGMAGPGQGEGQGAGGGDLGQTSDPGQNKGIFDYSGDPSSSDSGAGGSMKGKALKYELSVRDIKDVTAAHIHMGKKTSSEGPVVAALFLGPKKSGEFSGTLAQGVITDKDLKGPLSGKSMDELTSLMKAGEVYVNVHTAKHPAGEIRGQVSPAS